MKESDHILREVKEIYATYNDKNSSEFQMERHIAQLLENILPKTTYRVKTNPLGPSKIDIGVYDKSEKIVAVVEVKKPGSNEMVDINNLNDPKEVEKIKSELTRHGFLQLLRYYHELNQKPRIMVLTDGKTWIFLTDGYIRKNVTQLIKNVEDRKDEGKIEAFIRTEVNHKNIKDWLDFKVITLTSAVEREAYNFSKTLRDYIEYGRIIPERKEIDDKFYKELMHILGFKEINVNQQPQLIRSEESDSLFNQTIRKVKRAKPSISEEEAEDIARTLVVLWITRILFIKLFESILMSIDSENRSDYEILTLSKISSFTRLNDLFYEVMNTLVRERTGTSKDLFKNIPYLNSSLFERHKYEEEYQTEISSIDGDATISLYRNSILKDFTEIKDGKVKLLDYLLSFLNAYSFEGEIKKGVPQITTKILGNIFEKLNGYKAGAFYTPSEITSFIIKETIDRHLIDEYNRRTNSNQSKIDEILSYCASHSKEREILGDIIDNMTVLDPAVGTAHFLVSALNYIVYLKYRANLIENVFGYNVNYHQDELFVEELSPYRRVRKEDGSYFVDRNAQKFRKNIFEAKRKIIENNLFGVDINEMACDIARWRLWLELLKHAYYTEESDYEEMETLPNIDINIKCFDSLLARGDADEMRDILAKELFVGVDVNELLKLWLDYQNASDKLQRKSAYDKLEKKKKDLLRYLYHKEPETIIWVAEFPQTLKGFNKNKEESLAKIGFDIILGNPPYISTKEIPEDYKDKLDSVYNFADDLYNHFYFRGLKLLKERGYLGYITSKTFWTIQTKKNLRELLLKNKILLLFDTANPFESAMVDTCLIIVQKTEPETDHVVTFIDGRNDLLNHEKYFINQNDYYNSPNQVIFIPTDYNKRIYERYGKIVNNLLKDWWDKISTSKNIHKFKKELEQYRNSIKPGDITLLGLITEGGQGLATGNNGKYIGVLDGTKWADNVREQRPEKLLMAKEFCEKEGIRNKQQAQEFLNGLSEKEIRQLFDELKEKYGRDIFGQGWLYRIVSPDEIAEVEKLTEYEKLNGIAGTKTFVPYDKGDKEGNRWYAPTPYYIDWSRENVKFLKENSGKKGEGMPVVRNQQFYFREGFCWNNVLSDEKIKCRLNNKSVYSTEAMTLFSLIPHLATDRYFVCLLNSTFLGLYRINFINASHHLTTGDAKEFPIIIPTPEQLKKFEDIFHRAHDIQKQRFSGELKDDEAERELEAIQEELDKLVEEMYMG